jgi:hypothetical protein
MPNSYSSPQGQIKLFNAGAPDAHPRVDYSAYTQPMTLIRNPGTNNYSLAFANSEVDAQVRVYVIAFTTSVSSPTFRNAVTVPHNGATETRLSPEQLNGATTLWIGAWWANNTYPATDSGIDAYFAAHPSGAGHHTTPIIVG